METLSHNHLTKNDIGRTTRKAVHKTSKQGKQAYKKTRNSLERASLVAAFLLQNLLKSGQKQADKRQDQVEDFHKHTFQPFLAKSQGTLHDTLNDSKDAAKDFHKHTFQPFLVKTQDTLHDTLNDGKDAAKHFQKHTFQPFLAKTQDVLHDSKDAAQHKLEQGIESARDTSVEMQKKLRRVQKDTRKRLSSSIEATQDTLTKGSRQVRNNLAQVGSSIQETPAKLQKQYKHAQRKRARAARVFRYGIVIGLVVALLYAPLSGAEMRKRLGDFWKRYNASMAASREAAL